MRKRNGRPHSAGRGLILAVCICLLTGGFFIGIGTWTFVENRQLRRSYEQSEVQWKRDLAEGADGAQVRDQRNQELAESMKALSMNRELIFADGGAEAEARIAVGAESHFRCTVSILRDATGELLYESGRIDPGFYIEKIRLDSRLQKGYYPCTAVWSFYAENGGRDEYIGETAWKLAVVVEK